MNITWKITNIEWIDDLHNLTNVVKNIHWWVQAEDEDGNRGYVWGNTQLEVDNITKFIPLDDLNEETVLVWLYDALEEMYLHTGFTGREALEIAAIQMCEQQDPITKRGCGLPW